MSEPTKIALSYQPPVARPSGAAMWWPLLLACGGIPSIVLVAVLMLVGIHIDLLGEFFAIAVFLFWPVAALVGMVLGSRRLQRHPRSLTAGVVILSLNGLSLFVFITCAIAVIPH